MSKPNRVNVFLERARQLSSQSSKVASKSKSPIRTQDEHIQRTESPFSYNSKKTLPIKQQHEKNIINDLESMIEDFLQSRYNVTKKLESHKLKELKVISDLKKTLDFEIERNKINDIATHERNYKEKAEKVLMIVKQEALSIDKKLAVLKEENLKLKQMLSEKNIEIVDKKINGERINIDTVVYELAKKGNQRGFEREEVTRISGLADRKFNKEHADQLIDQIVNGLEGDLIPDISLAIENKKTQFNKNMEHIEEVIGEKKIYINFLAHKIKAVEEGKEFNYLKNDESLQKYLKKEQEKSLSRSLNDDEIFMVESEMKLNESKSNGESLNGSGILDQVYQEILQGLE